MNSNIHWRSHDLSFIYSSAIWLISVCCWVWLISVNCSIFSSRHTEPNDRSFVRSPEMSSDQRMSSIMTSLPVCWEQGLARIADHCDFDRNQRAKFPVRTKIGLWIKLLMRCYAENLNKRFKNLSRCPEIKERNYLLYMFTIIRE